FVLAADARDRSVEEYQREVLRLLAAEFVHAEEVGADAFDEGQLFEIGAPRRVPGVAQQAKTLFGQREEDVVLAGKVAIDGGRAVFNALGDLADRHVLVALGDEEVAGCVENRAPHGFPVSLLTFFDAHEVPALVIRRPVADPGSVPGRATLPDPGSDTVSDPQFGAVGE